VDRRGKDWGNHPEDCTPRREDWTTRTIWAYRIISFAAATTLVSVLPLELVADMHAEVLDSVRESGARKDLPRSP